MTKCDVENCPNQAEWLVGEGETPTCLYHGIWSDQAMTPIDAEGTPFRIEQIDISDLMEEEL